jgi:hypothetical protein
MIEVCHEPKIAKLENQVPQRNLNDNQHDCDIAVNFKRTQLAEAADHVATSMQTVGRSWGANWRALKTVGIVPPQGNACDITSIPGMTKMPEGTKLKPGNVVTIGANALQPEGFSFIVTEDMKAASDSFTKIPNLSHTKNVRVFRFEK